MYVQTHTYSIYVPEEQLWRYLQAPSVRGRGLRSILSTARLKC